MFDGKSFGAEMVGIVRDFVTRSLDPIKAQMVAIEQRVAEIPAGKDGELGPQGMPGKDGAPGLNGRDGARGECGEPGPAGKDGKDADKAIDGRDGRDGLPGVPGMPGERGADGINGKDGKDADKAIDGRDGRDGLPGVPGMPGERGADGINGKDGKDGFSLEDFDAALGDDGRTLTLKFVRGEVVIERQIRLSVMLYRDVWKDGEFDRGDTVTWDGSLWHCQTKTTAKPGSGPDWKLCAKRGNNGRDGRDGVSVKGERGPAGSPGRDLTQMGFDGGKH
jgi:hypothetical protein